MEIPVNVYWKKVLKHLWVNVAGSSRGSSRVTETATVLGRTRIPQATNLTTLYNSDFFNTPATQIRAMIALRNRGIVLPPLRGTSST